MLKIPFLALLLLLPAPALAGLKNENLLLALPKGYTLKFSQKRGNFAISEYTPKGQNVKNWREMLTVTINFGHFNGQRMSPQAYQAQMVASWNRACPDASFKDFGGGRENGYPTRRFLLACKTPETRPEYTIFKVIAGDDSFYTVQKAFRFAPSRQQITRWLKYMAGVRVCDSRKPQSPCP